VKTKSGEIELNIIGPLRSIFIIFFSTFDLGLRITTQMRTEWHLISHIMINYVMMMMMHKHVTYDPRAHHLGIKIAPRQSGRSISMKW